MFFANNIKLLVEIRDIKNYLSKLDIEEKVGNGFLLYLNTLHFGNFILWLWTYHFIHGVKCMILSGSFATWYWTMNKKQVPKDTVKRVTSTVIR